MKSYSFADIDPSRQDAELPWVELMRSESLSVGRYSLSVGEDDLQEPHNEDEIYVVVTGRARLVTPDGVAEVGPGSVLFVPAHEEHRFDAVTEDLTVVVVFAPPETDPQERPVG